MKNQNLKNLVRKSNLLEQKEDFYIMESSQSHALRGGGDGVCDNDSCPIIVDIDGVCNKDSSCTSNNSCPNNSGCNSR